MMTFRWNVPLKIYPSSFSFSQFNLAGNMEECDGICYFLELRTSKSGGRAEMPVAIVSITVTVQVMYPRVIEDASEAHDTPYFRL